MQNESEHFGGDATPPPQTLTNPKRVKLERLAIRLQAFLAGETEDEPAYREFAQYFLTRFKRLFENKGVPNSEATDLAETCITDIALKANHYQCIERGSFEAWVFKLARRALADWYESHVPTITLQETAPPADGVRRTRRPVPRTTPDQQVITAVQDALAHLKKRDRELIELRDFIDEHTYEEIAQLLNKSPGALRVKHHRLLQQLREIFEHDPRMSEWLTRGEQLDEWRKRSQQHSEKEG